MAECNDDYSPGPWKGYDYSAARKTYDPAPTYNTSYSSSGVKGPAPEEVVPTSLETNAKSPIIIVVDGTGSMGDFPEVIFKKLPLLDDCAKDYLDDVEISFAMVGDAGSDRLGLQVRPFTKGTAMIDSLNKLSIERGGGSNEMESYDLAALYYLQNAKMPKATNKPILIFVCDEGVYPRVDRDWAKNWSKVELTDNMTDKKLFEQLTQKYSVYCIRKHYGHVGSDGNMTGSDLKIHKQWESFVGGEKITILQDANRIVDLILGILATETDNLSFFEKELSHRQTPAQVAEVMKSMVSIGKPPGRPLDFGPDKPAKTGLSIAKRPKTSVAKGSKSLLE